MKKNHNESIFIQCKGVTKSYGLDGFSVKVLKGVDLTIYKGEFVAIMGPSGSGKSTLMNLLGLLDTPTSGAISLENVNTATLSDAERAHLRNRKIGFVFQTFNLLPRMSALSNIKLPLIYADKTLRHVIKSDGRARELLAMVGLEHRADHNPNQLSGGEQQRVAIARALVNYPSIIFADEPTGNLDSKTGKEIMRMFKNLHREENTIVIVTHDRSIAKCADRIVSIHDGILK